VNLIPATPSQIIGVLPEQPDSRVVGRRFRVVAWAQTANQGLLPVGYFLDETASRAFPLPIDAVWSESPQAMADYRYSLREES
jgi:hypothetical protein